MDSGSAHDGTEFLPVDSGSALDQTEYLRMDGGSAHEETEYLSMDNRCETEICAANDFDENQVDNEPMSHLQSDRVWAARDFEIGTVVHDHYEDLLAEEQIDETKALINPVKLNPVDRDDHDFYDPLLHEILNDNECDVDPHDKPGSLRADLRDLALCTNMTSTQNDGMFKCLNEQLSILRQLVKLFKRATITYVFTERSGQT